MTADQRLDQLEPVISEAITVLDRHTFQLKQLNTAVTTLTALMTKQSDNISFLLAENVHIKDRLTHLEADVAELKQGQVELKQGQTELRQGQADINSKLELILSKLSK